MTAMDIFLLIGFNCLRWVVGLCYYFGKGVNYD